MLFPGFVKVTVYSNIESGSVETLLPLPGYGMLCNENEILCDTEKLDCEGAVIVTSIEHTTTTYNKGRY